MFADWALAAARVDGRGFFDGAEVAAFEQAADDQIGEAKDRDLDAMAAGGDAQQRVGDHRGKDLQTDGVIVVAEEAADVEMLFDPAEQQLDLPSRLVESGDLVGRTLKVIGQQGNGFAIAALDPEPAQADRELRIALAGEAHLTVLEYGETIALGARDGRSQTVSRRMLVLGRVMKKQPPSASGGGLGRGHAGEGNALIPGLSPGTRVGAADPPVLALPDKPSIAVLPFANMSGDPEQEYFADGMVEEIITALSRIRWLFVIARNSTFTYKGQAVDVKQVGRELGVRYVLEGSVRKSAAGAYHRAADRCDERRASLGRPLRRLAR